MKPKKGTHKVLPIIELSHTSHHLPTIDDTQTQLQNQHHFYLNATITQPDSKTLYNNNNNDNNSNNNNKDNNDNNNDNNNNNNSNNNNDDNNIVYVLPCQYNTASHL